MNISDLLAIVASRNRTLVVGAITKLDQLDPEWRTGSAGQKVISRLRNSLWTDNPRSRELAAWTLLKIEQEETISYLLGVFQNRPWKLQVAAAEVLEMIGDHRATETLIIIFLEYPWPAPRAAAAALDRIDPQWPRQPIIRAAITNLIERLRADKWFIRQRAAWALGRTQDSSVCTAVAQLLEDPEEEVRATAARTLEALRSGPEDRRWLTAIALVHASIPLVGLGKEDIPALATALKTRIASTRKRAIDALSQVGHPSSIEPLLEGLNDRDKDIRRAARGVLDRLGWSPQSEYERAISSIISEDWDKVSAMGQAAIPALRNETTIGDPISRQNAAIALGTIGGEEAVAILVDLLGDPESDVRKKAVSALDHLGWQPRSDGEMTLLSIVWDVWEQAVVIGEGAVPTLIDLLANLDANLQVPAALALGKIRDIRAVDPLIRLLQSKGPTLRRQPQKH
jgi:HEAT repeat protein